MSTMYLLAYYKISAIGQTEICFFCLRKVIHEFLNSFESFVVIKHIGSTARNAQVFININIIIYTCQVLCGLLNGKT